MAVCENCLYRKNCQFLGKHKKAECVGCTAFVSEIEFIAKVKQGSIKEFAEEMKARMSDFAKVDFEGNEYYLVGLSFIDKLVITFGRKTNKTELMKKYRESRATRAEATGRKESKNE